MPTNVSPGVLILARLDHLSICHAGLAVLASAVPPVAKFPLASPSEGILASA